MSKEWFDDSRGAMNLRETANEKNIRISSRGRKSRAEPQAMHLNDPDSGCRISVCRTLGTNLRRPSIRPSKGRRGEIPIFIQWPECKRESSLTADCDAEKKMVE